MPSAPAAPSYNAPLLDFSSIGNLPKTYFDATQMARQRAIQNEFKDGLPTLTDQAGNPVINPNTGQPAYDINQIMQRATKAGGLEAAMPLLNLQMTGQAMGNVGRAVNAPLDQSSAAAPAAQPRSAPVPAHGIPLSSGNGSGSPAAQGQNEASNDNSLANIVQSQISDPVIAGRVITAASTRLGIDPGDTIDPNNPTVAAYIKTANGGVIPNGGTAGRPPGDNGTTVAQPSPATQPGFDLATADALEARARNVMVAATNAEALKPGLGAAGMKAAQADFDRAKQIREVYADNAKTTTEQKNLYSGATVQGEELKNEVTQSQKTYNGIQASATQYQKDMRPYLDLSKSILNQPEMYSGAGGNISLDFNKVSALLGNQRAAVLQEALQKVTATSVLGQINQQRDQLQEAGGTSSRIFSQQVQLVEKAAPSLANTVYGNRFLVNATMRMGDFSTQVAQQARDYITTHGHLDPGFDQQVSNYIKANPIFTKQELADPRVLGAPDAPPTLQNPNQIFAWATKMGIQSGEPFKTPDGRIKYLP
jgi:hypothetical protein